MENDLLDAPVKGMAISSNALSELSEAEREKLYQYAVNLMSTGFTNEQIYSKITGQGHSHAVAEQVINELGVAQTQVDTVKRSQKGNPALDIVLGVVFLVAGLAGTMADTGRIFYGAIIFGIIRLVKGIISLSRD